ncbi:MAG TPA: DUF1343 domain-containing protein [Chlamydiales bacterium]|nr:DUF1343 domain-containing protein [Chlamydiales bacterium]
MIRIFLLCFFTTVTLFAKVSLGIEQFFLEKGYEKFADKKIGIITNLTGVNQNGESTIEVFLKHNMKVVALFSPEHGINGSGYAGEKIGDKKDEIIPVYSLHGTTRRPTKEMMENIDLFVFDIQDIGSRSYTYLSTLCYVLEEAKTVDKEVIVLDRPNPLGGMIIDGPMLNEKFRSFIGYVNVPYCHGMTIGELAQFFNEEYQIKATLTVIPMKGWGRNMNYGQTDLMWLPPSPHIPEWDTAYFYPTTGLMGELKLANIGIGYTLPFKVVGAPWIEQEKYAKAMNELHLPGVYFHPIAYKPFYGLHKGKLCNGVKIVIYDHKIYQPVSTQFFLLGILKSLYPKKVEQILKSSNEMFCKACGTDEIYQFLLNDKFPSWKMVSSYRESIESFKKKREKYLLYHD